MNLDYYIKNNIKIDFILKKTFYPSENLDLVILQSYKDYCSYELYYKNGMIRGWRTISKEEIIEVLDEIIMDRSSLYHKRWSEINGISLEEQEKDLKNLKKFRNRITKRNDDIYNW